MHVHKTPNGLYTTEQMKFAETLLTIPSYQQPKNTSNMESFLNLFAMTQVTEYFSWYFLLKNLKILVQITIAPSFLNQFVRYINTQK